MEFRHLGRSGLKISEITYGNWLTHGSQVENDVAKACVQAALDAGISSFDTADAYANGAAESVLGEALSGVRRESVEIFTKVYWPTGLKGHNDSGLSRKHIRESIDASLRRLRTDYVDLYQHAWARRHAAAYLVTDAAEIPRVLAEAFHIAGSGRPGPVLVEIAKDAMPATTRPPTPARLDLPGYRPVTRPHGKQVREAARLLLEAKRPVLYVGGGVIKARASQQLRRLTELTGPPVVTTLMARGALPDSHPNNLGMPGMHGTVAAVTALQKADLLVSLGARFDDRVTGKLSTFAPHALVVHADVDPAEISKNRVADVPIVGDAREVIEDLVAVLEAEAAQGRRPDLEAWWAWIDGVRATYPVGYTEPPGGEVAPQRVIQRIGEIAGPDAVYVAGVGQHQMWASQFIRYEKPQTWINSGGLGTMGFAVPAAMGAKVGCPETTAWRVDGAGCFQMTNQELATCVVNDIPIKVAVINNSSLGMVRQWQTLFYQERYSNTDLHTSAGGRRVPDFVKLADAYGCVGLRCERPEDVDATIEKAMSINDVPVVVDFVVHRDAMVWPMVAAGVSNDDIQFARGMTPTWDREE